MDQNEETMTLSHFSQVGAHKNKHVREAGHLREEAHIGIESEFRLLFLWCLLLRVLTDWLVHQSCISWPIHVLDTYTLPSLRRTGRSASESCIF